MSCVGSWSPPEDESDFNQADCYENMVEEFRQARARYVCHNNVAPQTVRALKAPQNLNPNLVSYLDFNSLKNDCLKVYKKERAKAKEIFSNLSGHICLSVDLHRNWKSESANEHTCLSAHFIDDNWKLQKWVIKYCADQSVYPDEATLKSVKEWDIEGKILCLTDDWSTDTAAVVVEKVQEKKKLPLNGQLFHVQCCSDVISRMVEKGFEMIYPIIKKVELLSWSKSLPLWYHTSSKLRRALELVAMGEFSNVQDLVHHDVPSEEELVKVRSICKIADHIYDITKGLFLAKIPTANLFLPHLQEIKAYLTQEAASSDPFVNTVAQMMLKNFNEYWAEMYLVLAIAAFMDPRYKLKFLEFSSSKLGDENKISHVIEALHELYDGYMVQTDPDEDDEEESDTREIEQSRSIKDKLNILKEYANSVSDEQRKSDLDLYLEEPVLPWTENFSVLHWWEDNCVKYPQLSRMARDYLAIPMSVATSDDAFYTEPREADETLVSLKPKLMNAFKCTRSWKLSYDENDKAVYQYFAAIIDPTSLLYQ